MADLEPVIQANEIQTDLVKSWRRQGTITIHLDYDGSLDALTLSLVPEDEETAVYFVDAYVAFLYRVDDLELAGLYIEDFEQIYLNDMDALRSHWRDWQKMLDAKPPTPETLVEMFKVAAEIIQSVSETRGTAAPNLIEAMSLATQ